jgi:hypothetical protein
MSQSESGYSKMSRHGSPLTSDYTKPSSLSAGCGHLKSHVENLLVVLFYDVCYIVKKERFYPRVIVQADVQRFLNKQV